MACKRENPCGEPYESKSYNYYLADSNKANFPYTKIDTLVFVNQDWDTAVLVNSDGVIESTERNAVNVDIDPACPKWNYYYYEKMYTKFTGKNKNFNRIDVFMDPSKYNFGDELTFIINGKMEYRHAVEYFNSPSQEKYQIKFKDKEVLAVRVSNSNLSTGPQYPESKILYLKGESLLAWFVNDSNIYIKQ
ncbi:MAG: hypothetical protein MH472_00480 [Bacteroidia bacterium]|nr:hypothetical protein [Bacteroidia bacterium]